MPFRFVKPDEVIAGFVTEIDLDKLWNLGIRGFIFDLDNTLMEPHSKTFDVPDFVEVWLEKVRAKGFLCFLLTNNKREWYSKKAAAVLNMPYIHYAAKPDPKNFEKALHEMGLQGNQAAVVGDRPLTDIFGGQRIGAYTILVDPLKKGRESTVVQIARALERSLVSHPRVK